VGEPAPVPAATTLTSVANDRWDKLGELVTTQRAYLGYSIAQLAAVSGLSTSTVDSLEHARKSSYDPATLASLERALRWKPGSVERALRGLEPQQQDDPDLDAIVAAWPKLSPGARRMLRILAVEGARAEP
jgi:transcriptional regulator with XRE-family HTH domain